MEAKTVETWREVEDRHVADHARAQSVWLDFLHVDQLHQINDPYSPFPFRIINLLWVLFVDSPYSSLFDGLGNIVDDAVQVLAVHKLHVEDGEAVEAALVIAILVVYGDLIASDSNQTVPVVPVLLALYNTAADQKILLWLVPVNGRVIEDLRLNLEDDNFAFVLVWWGCVMFLLLLLLELRKVF